MYELSAGAKNRGLWIEVANSGGSTVIEYFLDKVLHRKIQ